jgi:hypothetical protein
MVTRLHLHPQPQYAMEFAGLPHGLIQVTFSGIPNVDKVSM